MAPKPPSSTLQAPAATSSSLSAPTLPHPAPSSANPTSKHSEQPPAASSPPNPNPKSKKRKRKDNVHILHQTTFRKPSWTYFHLNLVTPAAIDTTSTSMSKPAASPATASLDLLTVSSLLTPPLTAFLGLTGSSIAIDILKTQGCDVWIRVARQDARALRASLTGWMGSCEAGLVPGVEGAGQGAGRVMVAWRVCGEGGCLGVGVRSEAGGGDGSDLFGG